jgi:hypothetical protein
MRVFNKHIKRAAIAPLKRQSSLIIDPNMPRIVVPLQFVAWWRTHEFDGRRGLKLRQFALCHFLYIGKPCRSARRKKSVRVFTTK